MSGHHSLLRVVSVVLLVNAAIAVLIQFAGVGAIAMLSGLLPGKFGAGWNTAMTGNSLLGALVLYLDALLFLGLGFFALLSAARRTLLISPGDIGRLLRPTAGLSQEDIAATSFAVAEEQKGEIALLRYGRWTVWVGALLLVVAFAAVCFTFARAAGNGAALMSGPGGAVPNPALTAKDVALFTANQLANAVLLDSPLVYKWSLTALAAGDAVAWLKPFVLAFHILAKLIVFATLFAWWRGWHLRAYVLQRTDESPMVQHAPVFAIAAEEPAPAATEIPVESERHDPIVTAEEAVTEPAHPVSVALAAEAHEHPHTVPAVEEGETQHHAAPETVPEETSHMAASPQEVVHEPADEAVHPPNGEATDETLPALVHKNTALHLSPQEWRGQP